MSWSGTVTCSNCYTRGHNITSCPDLKAAWEKDPGSWPGKKWASYQARKAQPKTCGYCEEEGHTRAGCVYKKRHKQIYGEDLLLFRHALAKWVREEAPKPGALIRMDGLAYNDGEHWYTKDQESYVPPVGLLMSIEVPQMITHYTSITDSGEWMGSPRIGSLQLLGARKANRWSYGHHLASITFPDIPGIIPRYAKRWGGTIVDRRERLEASSWETVSPGHSTIEVQDMVNLDWIKNWTKEHFAAPAENTLGNFREYTDEQRNQMRMYINGDLSLSEMKDPELPKSDSY